MKIWAVVAICLFLIDLVCSTEEIRIPLTYAFDYNRTNKLPIELSFNHSYVYSTSPTPSLLLLNHSLSVPVRNFPTMPPRPKVQIGLKFPSDFIVALSHTYGVSYNKVQLDMSTYLSVILFDDNLMQSVDIWRQNSNFSIDVTYNYGSGLVIYNKPMHLIEGNVVFFEEYFIREVLHKMNQQNGINFKFNPHKGLIDLVGKLQNLPQLLLNYNGYVFKLKLDTKQLNYIPALQNIHGLTLVGYRAIKGYNKMTFLTNGDIEFKSSSMIYQLYLYLLYFVALFVAMVFFLKKNIYDTSQFAKNIFKWILFRDRQARLDVLKSELQ